MTITSLNIQDGTFKERRCRPRIKKRYAFGIAAVIVILVIIAIYLLTKRHTNIPHEHSKFQNLTPPNPDTQLPPSSSVLHQFTTAAVSSDAEICSLIGKDILKNGSAVDAIIATMFCNGLVTMQSMGLGGGFLMTIYSKEKNKVYTLNAREVAPKGSTEDMFSEDPEMSKIGPLAIAVPGELKGYLAAHKAFGKLPWASLLQPTIELCRLGYNISSHQSKALKSKEAHLKKDTVLGDLFFDANGTLKNEGALIIHEKYCKTLDLIAKDPDDFYNGTLADVLVQDIKELGGNITKEDLQEYQAKWEEPVKIRIKDDTFYSMPSPGSGNILGLILNILQGYNFTSDSIDGIPNTVQTYHRFIEAFKYAFAQRSHFGDPNFVNITELVANLTSDDLASYIRGEIMDNGTYSDPTYYGSKVANKYDHGTAHISVLAPNGDAVSATSTINLYFGSAMSSQTTGIILNSAMDDFSSTGFENYFGLPYAPANKIAPGKRPMSSMSPSIILDKNNDVKMVIGAAGGSRIPTSVALVIMRTLWLGMNIKEAIDEPNIHNQLYPMDVNYEYGLIDAVVAGLEKLGHRMVRSNTFAVNNAIVKENGAIYANADYRKGGDVAGY